MTKAAKQQTAEEYVRSRWEIVEECGSFEDLSPNIRILCGFMYEVKPTWSAAYAFTLEREEQIRQVEEEIEQVAFEARMYEGRAKSATKQGAVLLLERSAIWKRILAREQAALAELKKGFRQ